MYKTGIYVSIFTFMISGFLAVIMGLYIEILYFSGLENLLWQYLFFNSPAVLVLSGLITVLLTWMLLVDLSNNDQFETFSIKTIVVLIVFIDVMYGLGSIVALQEIKDDVPASLNHSLNSVPTQGTEQTWNFMQSYFECCGVYDASDWRRIGTLKPQACCGGRFNVSCEGCLVPIASAVRDSVHAVEVLIGLNALGILGVIASLSSRLSNYGNFHL